MVLLNYMIIYIYFNFIEIKIENMNLDVWAGVATLLTATFFLAAYAIGAIESYEHHMEYFYVSILYLVGSIFFFIYGVLVLYKAAKNPQVAF